MYTKNTEGLQQAVTVQRLVHNWVHPHGGLGKNKTPAMLAIKATDSGFGLLLMSKPAKLLGFISAIAPNKEPENFGIHCQVCTNSVLSLTRIFEGLTLLYSLHSVTRLLERSLVKPIILSGLTVQCGNVSPD